MPHVFGHSSLTRALRWGVGALVLSVLALVVGLQPSVASAAGSSQAELKSLRAKLTALDDRIAAYQDAILQIDQDLSLLTSRTSDLQQTYSEQVVAAYMATPNTTTANLLSARSARQAVDRIELARQIASYRKKLAVEMDDVASQVAIGRERREALRSVMLADQARSVQVRKQIRKLSRRARPAKPAANSTADELQRLLVSNKAVDPSAATSIDTRYWWGGDGRPAGVPGAGGALGNIVSGAIGMYPGAGGVVTSTSAEAIDQYLRSKGSPLAGQGFFFVLSGQRYGLDPRLLVAIAGAESSFGVQLCGNHNAWGWGCPNGPFQFASWAEGIDRISRGLRIGYIDEGRTSVAAIHKKYAPVGAANDPTGLNNHWVINVSKFLGEMGGDPTNVTLSAASGAGFGGTGAVTPTP